MKQIESYHAPKYESEMYSLVEDGIYRVERDGETLYVTSLSFEMEPESFGEEGGCPQDITQIPFEGILDEFSVYISDFYDQLNAESDTRCYQEFASSDLEDIRRLRSIIGRRVYAQEIPNAGRDEEDWTLVIE